VNSPARESAPQLRSPETDHPVRSGSSLMLPAIIVAIGLVGAALVWVAMSGRKPDAQNAETVAAVNPPPASSKTEQAVAPVTREVVSTSPPPVPAPSVVVESKPIVATPAIAVQPPAPVLPKLNGIFFNPAKPTAILNGKLVSPGSRTGEFTVLAITQTSVTLAGGGRTNVLSLSE
jgi:type IV secretory pathway VirB10-like protein